MLEKLADTPPLKQPFEFSTGPDLDIPKDCKTLLQEYFLASRNTIGSHNQYASFPIYDPSEQLRQVLQSSPEIVLW